MKRKKNQKIITKSLFICNLQCDFLVPVLKKTKMSQFSSPSKKNYNCPPKNDEKCPTLPRTTKKSLKKILQKKLKNNREKKIWKKLQNIHKKHMMNEKRLLNAVTIFWVKRMKNIRIFKLKKYASEKKNLKHFSSFIVFAQMKKKITSNFEEKKIPFFVTFVFPWNWNLSLRFTLR